MSQTYYTLLTEKGAELLANATALGNQVKLSQMAVGDGNGILPSPNASQTQLINEKRRAQINTLTIDDKNSNQIIVEQVILEMARGYWIREVGLFDDKGNLIAIGNCPPTYKPQLSEGSGRTQVIRMILIVNHTEAVELKIDTSIVLATHEYVAKTVADHLLEHEKSVNHPNATTNQQGMVKLNSATNSNSETMAATPKAIKSCSR